MGAAPTVSARVHAVAWAGSSRPTAAAAGEAVERYRERLGDDAPAAVAGAGLDEAAALAALHARLAGGPTDPDDPARASIAARLRLAARSICHRNEVPLAAHPFRGTRLLTAPPIRRATMAPGDWPPPIASWLARWWAGPASAVAEPAVLRDGRTAWRGAARRRRHLFAVLLLGLTVTAVTAMAAALPRHGAHPLEMLLLGLFAILVAWISTGFLTALAGCLVLLRGGDRYAPRAGPGPISSDARTAIVMPICNEDVARVFAGLRATHAALARSGELEHFDFFVLSDSTDPDICVGERAAWFDLCRAIGGFGRLFYRRRQPPIKRKSGNIADFCRRWGSGYRYMVVLDADSVMSGHCLVELVRLMEANPRAGIVQTAPIAFGRETAYARIQQFASRVYGPAFVAGLHVWQLGQSHYWGHNAIIRVAPFMQHCALGRLPGSGALAGEILSHDFVEAALMRRAGWHVWTAYDLPGSYEETPPNLVADLQRDRRWCRGNLINARLALADSLHPTHRAVFASGAMAYLASPLWLAFLLVSTALAAGSAGTPEPMTAPAPVAWLLGLTLALLLLPKMLGVTLAAVTDPAPFGGRLRLVLGAVAEMLFSAMLAPVRMLAHTGFVIDALLGRRAGWTSPPREDAQTRWREAARRHGLQTLFGAAWLGFAWYAAPGFFVWLLPVAGALLLSMPVSVLSSRTTLGRRLRDWGWFVVPEESAPPRLLRRLRRYRRTEARPGGFVDAVVDPLCNALACTASVTGRGGDERHGVGALVAHALRAGPDGLDDEARARLLRRRDALSRLHFAVWTDRSAHETWRQACGATRHTSPIEADASGAAAPDRSCTPQPEPPA